MTKKTVPLMGPVTCEAVFTLAKGPVPALVQFAEAPGQLQTMTLTFSLSSGEAVTWVARSRPVKPPPVGFGTQHYDVEAQKDAYIFEPVAGEQLLDPDKAVDCPGDYRFQEIVDRFSRGPIEFRCVVGRTAENGPPPVEFGRLVVRTRRS